MLRCNQPKVHALLEPSVNEASGYKGDIYMVFDYAEHDLTGMMNSLGKRLSTPQVRCSVHAGSIPIPSRNTPKS